MKKLIFGYGVTGKSVETYFQKNNIEYLIYDDKPKSGIKSKLFFKYSNIEQIDEVIISPGIKPSNPLLLEIESRGIEVVTDIDIFNKIYSGEIIGITGTNGKTTLVNLLTGYLNLIGKKSIAVGNVGNPPLDIGEQAYDYVVMELSSFQLYYLNNLRLNKAVLMNIFEDHLDWHTSIDEYILTKEKIGKFVKSNEDYIRYNNLEQKTYDLVIPDGGVDNISELPFYEDTIHLLIKIVQSLELSLDLIYEYLLNYLPEEHRFEIVDKFNDVTFINDSKSTNFNSVSMATTKINEGILIMHGLTKNISGKDLVIDEKVKTILIPKDMDVNLTNIKAEVINLDSIFDLESELKKIIKPGCEVLFSCGGSSFNDFKDYKERGEYFKKVVSNLKDENA